jgi:hypothetical protein
MVGIRGSRDMYIVAETKRTGRQQRQGSRYIETKGRNRT